MRALLRGERHGTPAQVALAVALLAVSVAAVALAGVALQEASSSRHALDTAKQTIYARCLQRQGYDQAMHDAAVGHRDAVTADLDEQVALERLLASGPSGQALRGIFEGKITADRIAIAKDTAAIARGVIGACQVYR